MSSPVSFRVSERDVYIIIDAGTRPSEVKAEQLQKAWQASDYSAAKLLDPQMMAQTATKYAQHFSKDSNSSISFQVIIAEIFDADLNLLVSDDDMKVTASAIVGFGGKPLTQEAIIAKLKEKKVTSGIQRKAIDALVEHTNEAPPGAELSVTVAKGKYPINGSNAKFKPLADDARKRVLRPQLREDGTADMRDLGAQVTVDPEQPLLQKIPPSKGRPGFTVFGQELEAHDGEDRDFKPGEGTRVSETDSNLIVADRTGMPSFNDNSVQVDDVMQLNNVDVSTGHVKFKGSVIVSGNVSEGMKVTCSGDITVGGYVDSAELYADGNITVRKGCIGRLLNSGETAEHDEDADDWIPDVSTKLVAGGSIWCAYAQYSCLDSQNGVHTDKQLTHCHVITKGQLAIGGEGRNARGKLIGGTIETCDHIYCGQLGAPAGTKTRIYWSLPPVDPQSLEHLKNMRGVLAKTLARIKVVQQGLDRCKTLEDGPKKLEYETKLKGELRKLKARIVTTRISIDSVLEAFENHPVLRTMVSKEVFPGILFIFKEKSLRIKEHRNGTMFLLQDKQLRVDSLV
ncbi:DUF342 domain-containing protein [Idiomarina abyssalis]|jgi:uncharacterized protein (DUF342 family)|uniref:DUF342 domain-containing protein n=2 Tax=Idiomarina abyssalis TaxID=86102 RepID=A0A8I1G9M7_9GAMM|nr:FapA family protein [Idiomarina abyssalis]MBJ7265814.1 DUF342 domain-containing protein [Idiomarina abyssalis]MBJ7273970.1 DUF342 domain-containing protein [Idiomarina abyssalis]MBJ7315704.1 DUF342 domain-containing protein [Idiomarina abyssalis]